MPKSNGLKYIFLGLLVAAFLSLMMCGVTLRRMIEGVRSGKIKSDSPPTGITWGGGPAFPASGILTGHWQGQSVVPGQACNVAVDVEEKSRAFSAYTVINCFTPHGTGQTMAILAGVPTQDRLGVAFHVVREVGGACKLDSFTLTPFPSGLAAEWRDSCAGGSLMLRRTAR